MTVREDEVVLANGSEGIYGVVEKPDFAIVIPCDESHVWLVEQFRYTTGKRFWEFPQGGAEPGATAEETARKELREETGLIADAMTPLGTLYHAYGYSSQRMHVFLASQLSETGVQELDPEEGELICKRFTITELHSMMRDEAIRDAASFAAFGLWQLHLQL